MNYLVCYDITDDRRRDRCANALLDFGRRLQESVFLASLDGNLLDSLLTRLRSIIEPSQDSVHVFPLCESCIAKLISLSEDEPPRPKDFYIV